MQSYINFALLNLRIKCNISSFKTNIMEKTIMTTLKGDEFQSLIVAAIKRANSEIGIANKLELDIDKKMNQNEAAKFLGVSLPTIIRWKKQKKIPYYQTGRVVIFKKSELLNAMQKNKSLIK